MAVENIFEETPQMDLNNMMSGDLQQSPDFGIGNTTNDLETDPPVKAATVKSDLQSMISNSFSENFAPAPKTMQSEFFDAKGANIQYNNPDLVDKYIAQDNFNPLTYNPQDESNNIKKYAQNETWGSALGKAFDSFAFNFGNTFTGWFADYPKMVDAIFSLDWEKMKPDEESLINEYYAQQKNMNENYVFAEEGHENDIFSKKFVSEFVGNAGFAMGTVAALSLEFLADAAITVATEGAGFETFFGTSARAAAKIAARESAVQAAEAGIKGGVKDFFKGFNVAGKSVDEIPDAFNVLKEAEQAQLIAGMAHSPTMSRRVISSYADLLGNNVFNLGKATGIGDFLGKAVKATPLLGTTIRNVEKIGVAKAAGASLPAMIGMGVQAGRRVMQELNMSASEAYFEGVSSYGDTLDKMYKQYVVDNNESPTYEQYEKMKDLAVKSSSSNYDTNMQILLVTNRLQFGNLFNRYLPSNKVVQDLLGESSERILTVTGKNGLEGVIKKGKLLGTVGSLGKVWTEFGKKEAMYQLTKSGLRNFARFEAIEGLQENMQETSAAGWRDYYSGQFNGVKYTLGDAMSKGFQEQFTKQGWKTFLMGAMTGSLIRIPTRLLNVGVESANKAMIQNQYKNENAINPYDAYEKRLDDDITLLNNFIRNAKTGKFQERLFNFNAQVSSANDQTVSAAAGSVYNFENGKDNALLAAVSAANRIGTTDAFLKTIKNTISGMDAEQFKEEFGIDIEDTKYSSPQEFGQKVASDVKAYSKKLEDFKREYRTKFEDFSKYEFGTQDYILSRYVREAEEEALHIAALNSLSADMALQRAESVANDLRKSTVLANSAETVLRTLSNRDQIVADLGNIKGQIKVLEESLKQEGLDARTTRDVKNQIKQLQKESESLIKWYSFFDTRKSMAEREGNTIDDESIVFVGKRSKKHTRHKKIGNVITETNNVYNPQHREVLATFKKLLAAKNKQAGLDIEVNNSEAEKALLQLVDYIQLDKDTKDYLQAVEILTDKENFKKVTKNLQNGYYKYKLILFNDTFFNTFQQALSDISNDLNNTLNSKITQKDYDNFVLDVQKDLLQFKPYLSLTAIISDTNFGIEREKEISELQEKINMFIKKRFNTFIETYTKEISNTEISDIEYNKILQEDDLGYIRTNSIAGKLVESKGNKAVLSDREKELYEKFQEQVDLKIKERQLELEKEQIIETGENPEIETNNLSDDELETEDTEEDDDSSYDSSNDVGGYTGAMKPRNKSKTSTETQEDKKSESKKTKPAELSLYEEEDEEDFTEEDLDSMFEDGEIDESEYIASKKVFVVTNRLHNFTDKPIDNMQDVINSIISEIEVQASKKGQTYLTFTADGKNSNYINKVIKKHILESNEGIALEDAPEVVSEPEVIITNNFPDKTELMNMSIDLEDIKEISDILSGDLVSAVEDVQLQPDNIEAKKAELINKQREAIKNRNKDSKTISLGEIERMWTSKLNTDPVYTQISTLLRLFTKDKDKRFVLKGEPGYEDLISLGVKPSREGYIDYNDVVKGLENRVNQLKSEAKEQVKEQGLKVITDEARKESDKKLIEEINAEYEAGITALEGIVGVNEILPADIQSLMGTEITAEIPMNRNKPEGITKGVIADIKVNPTKKDAYSITLDNGERVAWSKGNKKYVWVQGMNKSKTSTQDTNAKADIERRRKNSIKSLYEEKGVKILGKQIYSGGWLYRIDDGGTIGNEDGDALKYLFKTKEEALLSIKTRYDAELDALEVDKKTIENSEKNVNFVNEEVSVESIYAKLKNNKLQC
jgi:hypothetical protein